MKVNAGLLAALTAVEAHQRLALAQREAEQMRQTVEKLMGVILPFADAFEATGLHFYGDADPDDVRFFDRNEVIPMKGLTMRDFRLAWEASTGSEATKSLVTLVDADGQNAADKSALAMSGS